MIDRPVRELMDASAPTVTPETTTKDLVHLLASEGRDGVAVVDADGAVVGIVTSQDLLFQEVEADEGNRQYALPLLDWIVHIPSLSEWERHVEKALAVTASDLMTREVETTRASETVHEAAKRMAKEGVSQLPVIESGHYVGMLTRAHIVVALDRFEFGGGA